MIDGCVLCSGLERKHVAVVGMQKGVQGRHQPGSPVTHLMEGEERDEGLTERENRAAGGGRVASVPHGGAGIYPLV